MFPWPFTVTPGAGSSKFLIEASSGIVRTGPVGFDFEDPTDRNYAIVIIARDLGEGPKSVSLDYPKHMALHLLTTAAWLFSLLAGNGYWCSCYY